MPVRADMTKSSFSLRKRDLRGAREELYAGQKIKQCSASSRTWQPLGQRPSMAASRCLRALFRRLPPLLILWRHLETERDLWICQALRPILLWERRSKEEWASLREVLKLDFLSERIVLRISFDVRGRVTTWLLGSTRQWVASESALSLPGIVTWLGI